LHLDPQQEHLNGHDYGQLIAVNACTAQVHDDNGNLEPVCAQIQDVPAQTKSLLTFSGNSTAEVLPFFNMHFSLTPEEPCLEEGHSPEVQPTPLPTSLDGACLNVQENWHIQRGDDLK
jgi:hypothetical protein